MYVRVNGVWRYAYRAVDQHGQVIDVLLSIAGHAFLQNPAPWSLRNRGRRRTRTAGRYGVHRTRPSDLITWPAELDLSLDLTMQQTRRFSHQVRWVRDGEVALLRRFCRSVEEHPKL